eukprot:1762362-Pyramimonas_sp.AAC.1
MAPRGPKRAPRGPREPQNGNKSAQGRSKSASPEWGPQLKLSSSLMDILQDDPKSAPNAPRTASTRPLEAPRRLQEAPKRRPRGTQEAPKRPPRGYTYLIVSTHLGVGYGWAGGDTRSVKH